MMRLVIDLVEAPESHVEPISAVPEATIPEDAAPSATTEYARRLPEWNAVADTVEYIEIALAKLPTTRQGIDGFLRGAGHWDGSDFGHNPLISWLDTQIVDESADGIMPEIRTYTLSTYVIRGNFTAVLTNPVAVQDYLSNRFFPILENRYDGK